MAALRTSLEKARIGTSGALVVSSALLLSPVGAPSRADEQRTEIRVGGARVERTTDARAEAGAIARAYLDAPITIVIGARRTTSTRRALGVSVDEAALAEWIKKAADPASELRGRRRDLGLRTPIDLPLPFTLDEAPLRTLLVAAKGAVDRAPVDARVDLETGGIVPESEGASLDVLGSLEAFRTSLRARGETFEATFARTEAARTKETLAGASIAATLGEFETRYNPANVAADRTHNLKVAASRIDGRVLLPGEVFDFNDVVGERSALAGFRDAPVIAGGELAEGLGGGTCQISGTLHAAVFFAGLAIDERQPHSRPSSYIKLGLDAMVAWPGLDFRFRNDFTHPIVLRMSVAGGTVTARILGPSRARAVTFVRRIDHVTRFDERVENDPSLPLGVRVLAQRGVPGFGVSRVRTIRDVATGRETSERTHDVYPPTTQIWRVGSGAPKTRGYVAPAGDAHPEYRADSFVQMTQGPGIVGTRESLRPGDTGTVGWTVRAGMPAAE